MNENNCKFGAGAGAAAGHQRRLSAGRADRPDGRHRGRHSPFFKTNQGFRVNLPLKVLFEDPQLEIDINLVSICAVKTALMGVMGAGTPSHECKKVMLI